MIELEPKYTLLIDMDDTIENLAEAWCAWLNSVYGTAVVLEDHTEWAFDKAFPELTKEQVYEPLFREDFWNTVKPTKDAMYYMEQLWNYGVPMYICTASHPDTVKAKYNAIIRKYFPFIPANHFITISNKKLLNGWYLIDDGTHNFGGNYKGLLMDKPWNRLFNTTGKNIVRVHNWKEIYDIIMDEIYEVITGADNEE
mgnify:CR=1 FL=1